MGSFKGLGPIDLVQLTKLKQGSETSLYHWVSGIDVSSSAAAAAHINTLTFILGETQVWFGSHRRWKIVSGVYCCWNAFSGVEVRVHAKIPGGVESYTLTLSGLQEQEVSDQCWLETYMSAMLRALLYVDDDSYSIAGSRREDPFPNPADVQHFFNAFEKLFLKGPKLGATPRYQTPGLTTNYMVDGFFVACTISGMWDEARATVHRIAETVPAARDLLPQLDLLADNEISAIKEMVDAVTKNPRNAEMLAQEAAFCLTKNDPANALDCALRASSAAPSQFFSWDILAKVYISQEKYEEALLALNSCPLVQPVPMDIVRMPPSKKIHLPLPTDGQIDDVWEVDANEVDTVDPSLTRLTGGTLKGGSQWAYDLIATIFAKVGWAELMRIRGEVFLMETETNDKSETPKPDETNGMVKKSIKSKRLCERRLDSLFMVLYEDARAHSQWQREAVHFESQQLPFVKSGTEWEILGRVAQRLHFTDQALFAFEKSLKARFNHRVAWCLLDHFCPEKGPIVDVARTLELAVKLMAWNHRWYCEFSPRLRVVFKRVVALEGITKIRIELEAMFGKTGAIKLINNELDLLKRFHSEGTNL